MTSYIKSIFFVYVSHSKLRNGCMLKIYWVSPKLVLYSNPVFKPQGTVYYELNVSHLWHSTTVESII